jgi:hypothetical protein
MPRLLIVAALVMFVFALIAGAADSGTFLSVAWPVWMAAGFVAYMLDLLLGDRLVAKTGDRTAR